MFVGKAVFGYRWHEVNDGHSPFYFIYGVKLPLVSSDEMDVSRIPKENSQDSICVLKQLPITEYEIGNLVLMVYGNAYEIMK